jgi:hypothetical protein
MIPVCVKNPLASRPTSKVFLYELQLVYAGGDVIPERYHTPFVENIVNVPVDVPKSIFPAAVLFPMQLDT